VGRNSGGLWSGDVLNTTLQAGDTVFIPEKTSSGSVASYKNLSQTISLLSGAAVAVSVIRTF
jgi:hypothetical protein